MPAFLPLIAAGLQLGGAVYQGIRGYKQRKEANKINPVRHEYQTPSAMTDQVDLFRGLAYQSELPQQNLIEDKINSGTSTGINAIKSAGGSSQDVIAGASNLVGKQTRSLNDLAIAGANLQRGAQTLFGNSLGQLAQYQDREFMLNKLMPYYNDVARKQALLGAGDANIMGAFNSAGNIFSEMGSQNDNSKYLQLLMAGQGG